MKVLPLLIAINLAAALPMFSQAPSPSPTPDPAMPKGLHVLTIGHSFHAFVGPITAALAELGGIQGHKMDLMSLGGSTVLDCWEVPNAPGRSEQPTTNIGKDTLATGTVDVMTLSPIWMPDEGIDKFAEFGLAHNPNLRITVQEYWMPNDTYESKYPLDSGRSINHDATDLAALRKAQDAYDRDVEAYVSGVNKKLGRDVISIVPVGPAVLALREKVVAGQVPEIKTQNELFRDGWGHPETPIMVLSAYCHYAVIYHRSPVGLPMPKQLHAPYHTEAVNQLLQELAWAAVKACPMSGVK